jgi:hypothetical protein
MVGSGSILELFFFGLTGRNYSPLFPKRVGWIFLVDPQWGCFGGAGAGCLTSLSPRTGEGGGDGWRRLRSTPWGNGGISSNKSKSLLFGEEMRRRRRGLFLPPWVPGTNPNLSLRGGRRRKSGGSGEMSFFSLTEGSFISFKVEQNLPCQLT